MAKGGKDYFGLGRLISIILAIIPVTSVILGILTRFSEKKIVAGIIRIIPFFMPLIWLVDLILMVLNGKIWRLINA